MKKIDFYPGSKALLPLMVLFLFTTGLGSLPALQITTLMHGGNLSFDKTSETSESGLSGSDYFYGLSLYGQQPIDENLTLKAGLKYDPILRYTAYTTFQYSRDFYTIAVGPFFGILNSWNPLMKSGISTSVRLDFPGIAFASFRSDSSIAARFTKAGDYLQENNSIEAGYYIPFAICSVSLNSRRYVSQQTAVLEVDDSFTEYAYNVDIFQKNVPVRVLLSFAYQQLERTYTTTISNSLNSLILGTRFRIEVSPSLTLITRMDSNIYSFGKQDDTTALSLPDSGIEMFLFRAELGAELNL
jgi:hypothetical protein